MGSALIGSLQISCFLTEGLFRYSRLPTFVFPKVPGRAFSYNLSKLITFAAAPLVLTRFAVEIHYFCSGPIGVDPICPQATPELIRSG